MQFEEIFQILEREMERWGLLEMGWTYSIDKPRKQRKRMLFGLCDYTMRTIFISEKLPEVRHSSVVLDVIRHEIAHALVGTECGHGDKWKKKAIEVGAEPKEFCEVYTPSVICLHHETDI